MGIGKGIVSVVMCMMNRLEIREDHRWSFFLRTLRSRPAGEHEPPDDSIILCDVL